MKITYIWHDSFIVECRSVNLLFDYWKDPLVEPGEMPAALQSLSKTKPLVIFVSHGHKDHYNPEIFDWFDQFSNVTYIVSSDVYMRIRHIISPRGAYTGSKVPATRVKRLATGEHFSNRYVDVSAMYSTDLGNSYLVTAGGKTLFHAGDLNAWIWKDESTPEQVEHSLNLFRKAIVPLRRATKDIDICFFPVDSRLGRDYFTGAKIMTEEFNIANFIPMHFTLAEEHEMQQREDDARAFGEMVPSHTRFIFLSKPGESCEV